MIFSKKSQLSFTIYNFDSYLKLKFVGKRGNLHSGFFFKIVLTYVTIYNKLFYNLRTLRKDNRNTRGCDQREL